jgi:hypothetical protein
MDPDRSGSSVLRGVVVLLALALSASRAGATAQTPDVISVDGKTHDLTVNPLERYLAEHPEKRPSSNTWSSANWRGYVAHWAVADGKLILTDVRIATGKDETASVLKDVFQEPPPIVATWFTGHLIIPTGKLVQYVHMGYASEFDRYLVLRIKEGVVTKTTPMDREAFAQFRAAQFAAFKKTETYRKAIAGDGAAKAPEEFLYQFYSGVYLAAVYD